MILKSIEIENFRCFRHSHFENFGQVNLIGGKNNAGKTALLEALLLANIPTSESIAFLEKMRGESTLTFIESPELAWSNFFYRQNKSEIVKLSAVFLDGNSLQVSLSNTEGLKSELSEQENQGVLELEKITDSSSTLGIEYSILNIESIGLKSFKDSIKYERSDQDFRSSVRLSIRLPNTVSKEARSYRPMKKTFFVPTGYKKSSWEISRDFDRSKLRNTDAAILEAFQIIDDSIEKIESLNIGSSRIYIFRKDEPPQALNFFGDALNKIADLILRVSNNPNCILLIDEIENGIHHTNQQEFWQMLIKLAVVKDVQIFATSHSAEMIGAFQAAAVANKQEDKVRFIEMYRSQRTGEIVGDSVDMETLAFDIQNNNPYRGEE